MTDSNRLPRTGSPDPGAGFTLVEMLVVLAIVGLVAAVATPWLRQVSRRSALSSAASQIQTTLLAARMRAVRRNLPASVLVVTSPPGGAIHELQTIEADPPSPTPTPLPAARLSISNDSLTFLTLPAANKITFDGGGRRVAPAGNAPTDIVIEGPTGSPTRNQVTIRTAVTGKVEVVTPAVWQ
jgi:prepilin-type N-terminal cleavage/methylation domain-containing protein